MKFSCEKAMLLMAVTIASRAASAKSAVPALEGLLIEAAENIKITGYDLKTGIITTVQADVEEQGSVVFNARLFGEIIRKLPDDIIYISVDDNMITTIKCGMSLFSIVGSPSLDYPELPAVESQNSVYIKQKTLKAMITQTNFAVSDNEARPIHTGSLFEVDKKILTVVSVDGFRLALRREEISGSEIENTSFVVPGSALSEVEKIAADVDDDIKITVGAKHVIFTIDSTMLISRRLEGEFLNYRQAIPQNNKYAIEIDKKTVISCVERVSIIINEKLKSPVRCTFEENMFKIFTATPLGKAYDECEVKGDGEGLEIGFNNKYLLDALKAAPSDKIVMKLNTGVSPCIIIPADGSSNFLYMILPVRLKSNES